MKNDKSDSGQPQVGSDTLFAAGDLVMVTRSISNLARGGDIMRVNDVRPNGWYSVSHTRQSGGAGFLARHRELAPANANEHPTGRCGQ